MSKDNVKLMFAKIEKDANFQKKFADLMRAQSNETEKVLFDKLIEFGKSSGFLFSKDDLTEARAELVDKLNSSAELNEKDLNNVSGGGTAKTISVVLSAISVGFGCAVLSLYYEVGKHFNHPGTCAGAMTTQNENCKNS